MNRDLFNIKKFRNGSLTDVLWLMFTLLIFVVVMRMQLEFSSVETIDTYAKNEVNSAFNTYVSKIAGFSTNKDNTKIFCTNGEERKYSNHSSVTTYSNALANEYTNSTSFTDNTSSVVALIQKSEKELKEEIVRIFNDTDSSWTYKIRSSSNKTSPLKESDITITYEEGSNSTKAIITVKYKINVTKYDNNSSGSGFNKDGGIFLNRKLTVVRTIENPYRFKS